MISVELFGERLLFIIARVNNFGFAIIFFANVEAIKLNYRIVSYFSLVDLDKI